jgi:pimeloyl-ACP methyl ester carboxylesterase
MRTFKLIVLLVIVFIPYYSQAHEKSFTVKKSGTGSQSILFIPGFASSGDVWNETTALLKGDYTLHVLTMAGFAGTSPENSPSFEKWKTDIAQYIKDNQLKKPIVVGHSMGGVMAMALAADYPDLLSKIIVVDALPSLTALMNPRFQSNPENDCSAMINQITQLSDSAFAQMQQMNAVSLTATQERFQEIVGWSISSDRRTFAKIYCDFSNTDLREKIKNITIPSLILLEPYFKNIETAINEQYKNLKTADLKYATKGLHFVMYDDKDWYIQQLNDFLTQR